MSTSSEPQRPSLRVGVLSDTHGLLRPRVMEILSGCDLLLHAGDVGDISLLRALRTLAPVTAVRGNVDTAGAVSELPASAHGTLDPPGTASGEGPVYRMTHRREDIPLAWFSDSRLLVFGHSHRPELERRGECLLLNPGACGHRRFSLPLTVAVVTVTAEGRLEAEILSVEG
ncbi:MAG: metallophosphoesterase family protein [Acidobacteriota bacterium]